MKNRLLQVLLGLFVFFMVPFTADAAGASLSFNCSDVTKDQTATCKVSIKVTSGTVSAVEFSLKGTGVSIENFTPNTFQGMYSGGKVYLYGNDIRQTTQVATITYKGVTVGQATLSASNVVFTEGKPDYEDFDGNNAAGSFYVKAVTTTTKKTTTTTKKTTTKKTTTTTRKAPTTKSTTKKSTSSTKSTTKSTTKNTAKPITTAPLPTNTNRPITNPIVTPTGNIGSTTTTMTDSQGRPITQTTTRTDSQGRPITQGTTLTDAQGRPITTTMMTDSQGRPITTSKIYITDQNGNTIPAPTSRTDANGYPIIEPTVITDPAGNPITSEGYTYPTDSAGAIIYPTSIRYVTDVAGNIIWSEVINRTDPYYTERVEREPKPFEKQYPGIKLLRVDDYNVVYKDGKYYATTDPLDDEVIISAIPEDGVIVLGTGVRGIATGKNVVDLILKKGTDTVNVQVIITRPDGTDVQSTSLTSLKVVDYEFAFDPKITEYSISVPYTTKELYVIAKSLSEYATIGGDGLHTIIDNEENTIYVQVSYGSMAPTEYVIHVKKNYTMLIMWIVIGLMGAGLIAMAIYNHMNKKEAVSKVVAEKDKVIAEGNRTVTNEIAKDTVIAGQNLGGITRKTVKPTLVSEVTPAVAPQPPVEMSQSAPQPQVRVIRRTSEPQIKTTAASGVQYQEDNIVIKEI